MRNMRLEEGCERGEKTGGRRWEYVKRGGKKQKKKKGNSGLDTEMEIFGKKRSFSDSILVFTLWIIIQLHYFYNSN